MYIANNKEYLEFIKENVIINKNLRTPSLRHKACHEI